MLIQKTDKVLNEIVKLPMEEIKKRISLSESKADRAFWFSVQDKKLQEKQLMIIKRKDFIR